MTDFGDDLRAVLAMAELNGVGPLRAALDACGGDLKDLTVLAERNDPFRVDIPAGHRDGQWLADRIAALKLSLPKALSS